MRTFFLLAACVAGTAAVPAQAEDAEKPAETMTQPEKPDIAAAVKALSKSGLPKEALDKLDSDQIYGLLRQQQREDVPAFVGPVAIAVPLGGLLFAFLVIFVSRHYTTRALREHEETLRRMIDKGVEIPKELLQLPTAAGGRSTDLRKGLLMLAVGIGIIAALLGEHRPGWAWGLVPTLLGAAFLLNWKLESGKRAS